MAENEEIPETQEMTPPRRKEFLGGLISITREPARASSDHEAAELAEVRRRLESIEHEAEVTLKQTPRKPIELVRDVATATRSMRKEYESEKKVGRVKKWVIKQALKSASRIFIGWPLEAPVFLGYGVGDGIAILNGVTGRDLYTAGGKIDRLDRAIYIVGGIVPIAPASVIVAGADWIRFGFESIFARDTKKAKK